MSGHTPGPWSVETVVTSCGSCHKIGPFPGAGHRREVHACVYADGIRIGMDESNPTAKELLANARLIAAAPMLLEALKPIAALRKHFTSKHGTRPTSGAIAAWHTAEGSDELTVEHLIAAVEAIAAATGEKE